VKRILRLATRFLSLLIIPLVLAIAGTIVRSAAELPPSPCREHATTGESVPGNSIARKSAPAAQEARARDLAILVFDGIQIVISYAAPYGR
jgi:hypothetical protein